MPSLCEQRNGATGREVPVACQSWVNAHSSLAVGVLCKEPPAFWPHQPRCAFADEPARKHVPEM